MLVRVTRRIAMLAVESAQILDVTGPLEVFAGADGERRRRGGSASPAYELLLCAPRAGELRTSSGVRLLADRALADLRGPVDTLIVAGGRGIEAALADRSLLLGLRRLARGARRVASVCTGTFLLAEAGLLEGRRVTTHWAACEALAARYPGLEVDPDPIYLRDGSVYTSAGVTAGMDLALALVEEDLGRDLALAVARRLVLFLKRPGGQAQFSAPLAAQQARREGLLAAQQRVLEQPGADLCVATLARCAGMSPRHFARVFAQETGATPARFVERARVEAARRLLEESRDGVEGIAAACGFGSAETMRRAFLRTLRVSPSAYRSRFRRPAGAGGEAAA
jgi:transcriptional regulator GlxA family with amidase domain